MSRYPQAPRGTDASEWHGKKVPDPYRWLEAVDSPQTKAWLAAQKNLLDDALADDSRAKIVAEALERNAPPFRVLGPAIRGGNSLFYVAADRQTGTAVYRVEAGAKPERLPSYRDLIPAPDYVFPSPSGRFLAIGARAPANEATTIIVFDTHRGAYLFDPTAPSLMPLVAWKPDETGFFYNAVRGVHWMQGAGEPMSALCLHHLGATKEEVIFQRPWNEGTALFPFIGADARHLIVQATNLFDNRTSLLAARLAAPTSLAEIIPVRPGVVRAFAEKNGEIYVATANANDQSEILALTPASGKTRTVLTLPADELKLTVSACATPAILTDSHIVLIRQWAGEDHLTFFTHAGKKERDVTFPVPVDISSVQCVGGNACVAMAQSFLEPATLVACDPAGMAKALPHFAPLTHASGASFERITIRSNNDAAVSMIAMKRAGSANTGKTLVLAYGGIGATLGPKFSIDLRVWLDLGGTAVVVHARGGGEYGAAWHKAGAGTNKTNTFADLRRALETIIAAGTRPNRIVVRAKSLGGLLTGFAYNNYPDLMSGIVSEMPLLAPLETLVSKQGGHMRQELGDPSKDEAVFDRVRAYSPLDNLAHAPRKPAHLIVAGDRDERVFAGWVYKYVATAQHLARDTQDVLLLNLEGAAHTQIPPHLARELSIKSLTFALRATDEAGS